MTKDDAKQIGIAEWQRKFFFRSFSGKLNFAPPIDESEWFEIVSVDLDNGFSDGDNVGVVTRWTLPIAEVAELPLETVTAVRLAVGTEKRWKEHQLAGMWVGKAIAPILGLDPEDKADVTKIKKVVRKLIRNGALKTEPGRDPRRREDTTFVVAT